VVRIRALVRIRHFKDFGVVREEVPAENKLLVDCSGGSRAKFTEADLELIAYISPDEQSLSVQEIINRYLPRIVAHQSEEIEKMQNALNDISGIISKVKEIFKAIKVHIF
jgi:hypothetical protein